jgi:hypothetical protein
MTEDEVVQWNVAVPDNIRFNNLEGKVFGRLTVCKYYEKCKKDHKWICKCACGNYQVKTSGNLKAKDKNPKQCWECTKKDKIPESGEKFLKKASKVHGDFYNYDSVVFKGDRVKVVIHCPLHGEFEQTPNSHVSGQGCRTCGRLKANRNHRNTYEEFLKRCRDAHGDTYDYSKSSYTNSGKKVVIVCKKHGEFSQIPKAHWKGNGCPVCRYEKSSKSLTKTHTKFLEDCKKVHGDTYNYSEAKYQGASVPVKIVCHLHGEFLQTPSTHLQGFGCSGCSTRGYNSEGGGFFYITTLNGEFIKYGITSQNPLTRMQDHSRHSRFIHELHSCYFFEDGNIPKYIESYVKDFIGKRAVTKDCLPDGYTETTTINKLEQIIEIVKDYQGEPFEL